MEIIHRERIQEFMRKRPDSGTSLGAWQRNMTANSFGGLVELKRAFGSADYVRPYVVFNIAGNKYRLVSLVDYELQAASVEAVLTHAEYDRGHWRRRP